MKMFQIRVSYGLYILLMFVYTLCLIVVVNASTVVIDSPFGKIQGAKKTDENTGQSYLSFKGIPYAKPPVGDLRFAKPQPHPKIDELFDATKDDLIVCPHPDVMTFGLTNFTEDCLILNIQMKDTGSFDSVRKVVVYIHGGGFIVGTSMMHESKSFVLSQDVIVVTINYRLGILGFLSTENEASPGNYGLWDQTLAIKWVKDNIRDFGGDPDDITIAGESAGGASVGLQTLSPHAKGLFTKAYLLSGTASSVFARSVNAQSHALAFARSVGCWGGDDIYSKLHLQESKNVIKCLRKLPLSHITLFGASDVSKKEFVTVIDGDFVPDIPAKLLKDDKYLDSIGFFDRTYLLSIVNNELGLVESFMKRKKAALSTMDNLSTEEKEAAFNQFVNDIKNGQMRRVEESASRRLGEPASRDKYIVDHVVDFYENRYLKENVITELMVDLNFLIPSLDFLVATSRRQSCTSYFLYLNHFPRFVTGPRKGIPHEADLAFWFDFDLNFVEELVDAGIRPELFDEDDIEIKRMFSAIVGEFARSGNPGLALKDVLPNGWPKYDVSTSPYLNFNLKPWVDNFLKKDTQDFWLNTVPSLIRSVESSKIVVDSPFGKIQGAKKTDENTGQSYLSFKGIPYAKPPVGDLRFAKPQPHPNIDGVLDASSDVTILCPHPSLMTFNETNFQEECLILNILTKDIHPSNGLRKVLVFVHGGGFMIGSAAYYEGKSFALSQDVIVVAMNYRLGVLGFLSTENEASPGNYGLWDQTLAIKWVKDNIRAFGGDPDDITIAGESAGGASVGFQILSPHAKGLFTRAYPQSGTASAVFAISNNAQSHALTIAKSNGCWEKDVDDKINVQESKVLIDCLRKVPFSSFAEFNDFVMSKTQFVPRVDGDFVPGIPAKLLQDDDYLESIGFFDRSYLFGINNNEVGVMENFMLGTKYQIFSNNETSEEQNEAIYKAFLDDAKKQYMNARLGESASSDENIVSRIDDFYYRRLQEDKVLINMITDLSFLIPALDFLTVASRRESCSSYLLYFDHFPHFMKGKYKGSPHGIDLGYWFDFNPQDAEALLGIGIKGDFDEDDVELKSSFSSIIGDFIKTGNPGLTLKNKIQSGWPKYDVKNSYYLNFNSKPWVSSFLEKEKQDLWLDTIPRLIKSKKYHIHSEL